MNKTIKAMTVGVALAVVAGTAFAQAKPEDLIKSRQAAYRYMAYNMGKIKGNLDGQFNKDQVAAAANVIAAIANSGMGALYVPGTEKGKGYGETRAKAELFTDKEGVGKVAMAFNKEANEMAKVAASGDAAAVREQFGKLGGACKGCHDKFRVED